MPVGVKICGLTNLADARLALAAGADFLGFVFARVSKRCVTPDQVREILRGLPADVVAVGVFVNSPAVEICPILDFCGLRIAQLNGEESVAELRHIGLERVWKACTLRSAQDVDAALLLPTAAVVADTAVAGVRGGTGVAGDWPLAATLAARRNLILAGGLRPENVADAVTTVRPWAVDVSSGVEAEVGRKSPEKVRTFIREARRAGGTTVPTKDQF